MRAGIVLLLLAMGLACGRIGFERQRSHGTSDAGEPGADGSAADAPIARDAARADGGVLDGGVTGDGSAADGGQPMPDGSEPHLPEAGIDASASSEGGTADATSTDGSDAGAEAGSQTDAATQSDGGTSTPDAGVPPNDTCNRPITLTVGVPTSGTTCGATDTISSGRTGCGPLSTPDVFYEFSGQSGVSYTVSLSEGAYVQRMLNCSMTDSDCMSSDTVTCSPTGTCRHTYLVETIGGCGAFTIQVDAL